MSNAWIIYLSQGDNNGKLLLIPHKTTASHDAGVKTEVAKDESASD